MLWIIFFLIILTLQIETLQGTRVLSNVIASQKVHEQYGGVVPELASRAHQQNIIPVIDTALKTAKIEKNQLSAIAFTRGPGLLGSLLVGTSFAKAFAQTLNIPMVEIDHMNAHILVHFATDETHTEVPDFPFPTSRSCVSPSRAAIPKSWW